MTELDIDVIYLQNIQRNEHKYNTMIQTDILDSSYFINDDDDAISLRLVYLID